MIVEALNWRARHNPKDLARANLDGRGGAFVIE